METEGWEERPKLCETSKLLNGIIEDQNSAFDVTNDLTTQLGATLFYGLCIKAPLCIRPTCRPPQTSFIVLSKDHTATLAEFLSALTRPPGGSFAVLFLR
jgi:hypothetical protein